MLIPVKATQVQAMSMNDVFNVARAAFEKVSKIVFRRESVDSLLMVHKTRLPTIPPETTYDPRDHRTPSPAIVPWMAYFNLIRTLCGPGLLGMPVALSASGLIIGSTFTILAGVILIHTHHLLLNSLTEISKQLGIPYISYRYGYRLALLHGPPIWHCIGERGPTIIAVLMVMSQLGISTVTVILSSDSLRDIIDCTSVKPALGLLLPCYLGLDYFMKSILRVSYVGIFGSFLNTVGLILIFYHIFKEPIKEVIWIEPGVGGWLFTSGMCMFNLSALGVILTLEKGLLNPRLMTNTYGVVNIGLGIPTLFSWVFGVLGYWAFGTMEENILRSLPYEDLTSMIAIGLYLISVSLTQPLHCYAAIEVIIEVLKYKDMDDEQPSEETLNMVRKFGRLLFVILTFTVAYYIPFQGPFVAFVGSLCTSVLSVICPVMMDIGLRYGLPDGYGKYNYVLYKDLFLLILGIICWLFGVYFCGYLIYIRILSSYSPNGGDFY